MVKTVQKQVAVAHNQALRGLMIVMAIAAIWSYIIAQAITYQARHLANHSFWDRSE